MWFWLKISICQSSMVHEGSRVNCPTRVGNLEASTVCWTEATRRVRQPGSVIPRLSRSSEGPCAQSGAQAKKASVNSLDFAWNCHSLFKYIHKNNSPWSPTHMLQMMSCSAVVWSQSYLSSHSLINNVIVCNISCYCSIINRKLYNK